MEKDMATIEKQPRGVHRLPTWATPESLRERFASLTDSSTTAVVYFDAPSKDMEPTYTENPDIAVNAASDSMDDACLDVGTTTTVLTPAVVDGVIMTPIGLKVLKFDITPDDFNTLFSSALMLGRAANWILGDTLDLADRTWGNQTTGSKYEQASRETGLSISTLRNIVSVCHNIPYEQRRPGLSFSHHLEANFSSESVEERERFLDQATEQKMSVRDLRNAIREERGNKADAKEESGETTLLSPTCKDYAEPDDTTVQYPLRSEFLRYAAWFSLHMAKVPKDQGKQMVDDLLPFLRDAYHFLRLRLEEEPDRDYDLPYDVPFLEE